MSFLPAITNRVNGYFKYATPSNPSKPGKTWKDKRSQLRRTQLVYQNCVKCNAKRFSSNVEARDIKGVSGYFCEPCESTATKIIKEFEGKSKFERQHFDSIWLDKMFE